VTTSPLPVAVIGAGPVGLAAAAHLLERGETPVVLEAGPAVGATVRQWAHVRVFSPWRYNVDPVAVAMLTESGWIMPDPDHLPTGGELVTEYLEPLAALPRVRPCLRLGTRVLSVSRRGFDKLRSDGRDAAPFVLRVLAPGGEEQEVVARAVIDASGTYGSPNPLGADGTPARGEAAARDRVFYGIPAVLGAGRSRYAGRRVAVVGSGHSALNTLLELVELASAAPGTRITWIVRRPLGARVLGGGAADALPARGALGESIRQLLARDLITLVVGRVHTLTQSGRDVTILDEAGIELALVDEVVAVTGFRPDLGLLRELRLDLDPSLEAPRALAPLIDPNVHSCGTVPPHGAAELAQPEPGFYVVGMKSYGRAPTFLLLTGYEQVRSVVAALAGDWEAARDVRLTLPATGVCSGQPAGVSVGGTDALAIAGSCCGGPAPADPAGVDACCLEDAEAKAGGHEGCGCGSAGQDAADRAPAATRPAPLLAIVAPGSAAGCCRP
jgi:thioredoxin reductase